MARTCHRLTSVSFFECSNRPRTSDRAREERLRDPLHRAYLFSHDGLPSHADFGEQVSGTIEGRILQIQKRKTAIVKEAFKGKRDTDPESIENLKIMFGDD